MPQINRNAILKGVSSPRVRKVDTPEWEDNGFVYVRELRASDATRVQTLGDATTNGKADESRALAGWCILGICDKAGKPVLTDDDMDALLAAPLAAVQRCALAIMEINGLTEEGESARKKSAGRSAQAVRVRSRKGTRPRRR
jgi:hypothetical protein